MTRPTTPAGTPMALKTCCSDGYLVPKSHLNDNHEEAYRHLPQGSRFRAASQLLALLAEPLPEAVRIELPPCTEELPEW